MNERDAFLQSQINPMLMPGERVLFQTVMRRQPGLLMQMLLIGGLLLFLMTKTYYVVLTNQRLILIRASTSFFSGRPGTQNLGVEQYEAARIQSVTTSGFANNRSMTFQFSDGTKQTLRTAPWFETITGVKAFFEQVPGFVQSGQLAAQAGAAQMGQGQQMPMMGQGQMQQQPMLGQGQMQQGQMPQQQMQAPMSQQQPMSQQPMSQQPMQMQQQQQQGPQPGAQVMVMWSDGNRYPATVMQVQNGQCLCAMQSGQQQWVPMQNISPG